MSKKNNKATKARYHQLSLDREKEAQQKKVQKAEKKREKEANLKKLGVTKTSKKTRKSGIRIRKGVTIKGIKIVDAESKRRAIGKLNAERKEHEMDVDEPKDGRKLVRKIKKKKMLVISEATAMQE